MITVEEAVENYNRAIKAEQNVRLSELDNRTSILTYIDENIRISSLNGDSEIIVKPKELGMNLTEKDVNVLLKHMNLLGFVTTSTENLEQIKVRWF